MRLDAAVQLGDTEQTDQWLGFMKEHRADAPRTYQDALLLTGDVESAAKWLIERLQDQDLRASTLSIIQEYAVPRETARQAELRKRTGALLARPDVLAEIQRVGRIQSYKIEALGH